MSSTNPIPGQRRMFRVVTPDMALEQAYKLGYEQGYSRGMLTAGKDYRRAMKLLNEERALTQFLKSRVQIS